MKNQYDEDITLYALRYALGRQSMASYTVTTHISKNIETFSIRALTVMAKDIESAEDLGAECDKKSWLELLKKIKIELQNK